VPGGFNSLAGELEMRPPIRPTATALRSVLPLVAALILVGRAEGQPCLVTTPIGPAHDEGFGVALQADGKIVVAGYSNGGVDDDFALVRYKADCALDPSFSGGKVTTSISGNADHAIDLAIQPDGKIVAVGFTKPTAGTFAFALVRYNPDGTLDTTFDTDGIVSTSINGVDDQARDVVLQTDGKIVVVGWTRIGANLDTAVVRYNSNGSLDTSFDLDGIVVTSVSAGNDSGHDVVIQPDGKIVVAGDATNATDDFAILRYNPNGSLDTAFDVDGIVTTDIGGNVNSCRGIALQSDGKIVAGGNSNNGANFDFAVVRYNPNGSLDVSFDVDGIVTTGLGPGHDLGFDVAVPPGKILMAGWAQNGANWDFGLVRYNSNGSLDTTFDGDGIALTPIGAGDDFGYDLVLQPDGQLVVVGSSHNGANLDFALVRYDANGGLNPCTPTVNLRSIGLAPGDLSNTGTATANLASSVVTFSGVSLPSNIGVGDEITLEPGFPGQEILYILSRDSATQVTLQSPTGFDHSGGVAYRIRRAYGSISAWETAREGDLVGQNRREVGFAYDDGLGPFTESVIIDGSTTDACRFMWLRVAPGHGHNGTAGTGVVLDPSLDGHGFAVLDDYTRLDGFEVTGWTGAGNEGVRIQADWTSYNQMIVHDPGAPDLSADGFHFFDLGSWTATIRNSIVYNIDRAGIYLLQNSTPWNMVLNLENVSVYNCGFNSVTTYEAGGISACAHSPGSATINATNVLSVGNADPDLFNGGDFNIAIDVDCNIPASWGSSSYNVSSDPSAPGPSSLTGRPAVNQFASIVPASEDLRLKAGADAIDTGTALSFCCDVKNGLRPAGAAWDIGADEFGAPTLVELASFTASALDTAVLLEWRTASELNNLGFHLYRATSVTGPYQRITTHGIPGLGSSPVGARYQYRDLGLTNGVTYFYKLEDIETTGKSELHGPVWATPEEAVVPDTPAKGERENESRARILYGSSRKAELHILSHSRKGAVLELSTDGFYAEPTEDGSVEIFVPGLDEPSPTEALGLPVKRFWLDVITGRGVRIVSVRAQRVERFQGLRPAAAPTLELQASPGGTVRVRRRKGGRARLEGDSMPEGWARLLTVGFQGDRKKALLELAPLRWDGKTSELLLARRLVVEVSFREADISDETTGRTGARRRAGERDRAGRVTARLVTTKRGLHAVLFEELFGRRHRGLPASALRLIRQGDSVAYRLEPNASYFGPGSTLYFLSEGAQANPYGNEAVFEVEVGVPGIIMPVVKAPSEGEATPYYWHTASLEENRYYQAALLSAPDVWLWDLVFAPARKSFPLQVNGLVPSAEPSRLSVWLQGASDLPASTDHHVRVYLNGTLVDELSWEGKQAREVAAEISAGLLREGENVLELENVGDTEAAYSMVMLDRFAARYPRVPAAELGLLEGSWSASGPAEVSGLGPGAVILDVSDETPRWLADVAVSPGGVARFRAEAERRYLVASPRAVQRPQIKRPPASALRDTENQADYLLIAPREFLPAARPLIELRRSQGLRVKAAAMESIYSEFGFGETTPRAIRDFLAYAYHDWKRPSVRYVLLVGDGTYDFKDYLVTGVKNRVPPAILKTTYLWTASDPSYAAVNGDDILPDLAIGRLPAASIEEVEAMVAKIVAYERGKAVPEGNPVVLIADNPDRAGDFEANADELASGVLAPWSVQKIYLSKLGEQATRAAIVEAFNEGSSLMSYVGHGGIHLWADENVFNTEQASSLTLQPRQPLLLTMNCLNGYFHFPYFNSLAEELVKTDGKGAIAAFSPSGLSLNEPAHRYHQKLLQELFSGRHRRLGDAVMAAQAAYAETGALPELLSIYHLLGDPALRLPKKKGPAALQP